MINYVYILFTDWRGAYVLMVVKWPSKHYTTTYIISLYSNAVSGIGSTIELMRMMMKKQEKGATRQAAD